MREARLTILQDIKTAVKMTGEIRKARREGAHIEARKVWTVPMLNTTYWPWTMEACLMCGEAAEKAVIDVFYALPVETQHSLTFTPKEPRGWVERAQFWAEELRPALFQRRLCCDGVALMSKRTAEVKV